MADRPPDRPTCKHGREQQCKDCWYENFAIRRLVQPLIDQYWTNRGATDIGDQIFKAFKQGMKCDDKEITDLSAELMENDRVKKESESQGIK